MSINNILSSSLSGLFANQAALRATSNNVANVNTEHYSRVRVELEANVTQGATAGVRVRDVSRVVDQFLETALRTATSNASEFTAQREFHDRLQGILGDPAADSSLSTRIDKIFQTVADLALNPADVLRRQQTISELQSFLDQTSLFQEQLQNLRGETSQQISENVDAINEQLQRIHDLNPLLAKANTGNNETGGLEGQMSQALADLSELIDIKIDRQATGTVFVTTSSGYPLVDTSLSQLSYSAPGIVAADTQFPTINISRVHEDTLQPTTTPVDLLPHVRSGRLQGLLEMRDVQLPQLSVTLGELGARVADEFNAIQNKYSAVPPPNTMTGKQTIVDQDQTHGFTGEVTFAVVNRTTNDLVRKITIDFSSYTTMADAIAAVNAATGASVVSTPGTNGLGGDATLSLTNGVMSFTATNAANGVVIVDSTTNPSQRAGRGFSHFFGMSDLITAKKPGIYETGVTAAQTHGMAPNATINFRVMDANAREINTVTVTVPDPSGSPAGDPTYQGMVDELNLTSGLGAYFTFALDSKGALTWTPKTGFDGAKLQVVADGTDIGSNLTTPRPTGVSFTEAFGMGDSFRANAANSIQVKKEIQDDPDRLALSVFDASVTTASTVLTKGDQRGALAFQALETTLVSFSEAGELKGSSVTLSQYVSRFLGNAGLQAARATNFEEDNLALQQEIGQRNSDISGVNLDEELANLVVYQNAYNAAARILSSVQELYDSLLAAV